MPYSEIDSPVLMLTCGPVTAYPQVLSGLSRPVIYDYDPAFQRFFERLIEKAMKALAVSTRPVILQGEPVLGLEAAAASLITPADTVLNLVSGVFGKSFGQRSLSHSPNLLQIEVPNNTAIDPQLVEDMFRKHPEITVVSVCHHETASGTLNPIDEIGAVVNDHGGYLIVDAGSSFGGMDVNADRCRADIFITGPNKCLGAPPGLTMLAISDRAWARMKCNSDAPRASVLSILDWENAWSRDRPFPYTPSIAELNGMDAALDLYLEEGPEKVWARHELTAKATRAGVKAMGLELWAADESIAAPTTTAIRVPGGVDEASIRSIARGNFGVVFSPGRGDTLGKLTRIGHMGPTAQPIYAVAGLTAYAGALNALGVSVDAGQAVNAALGVVNQTA